MPTFSPRKRIERMQINIGIICDKASALLISKWITDRYQKDNPSKPETLRRDMAFLFSMLKWYIPPILRPTINNIGKQKRYLNISTIAKETSFEKYFIIATMEVPKTISRNKKSAPSKYESLEGKDPLLKTLPGTFEWGYTSKSPAIKLILFFVNQSKFW